MKLLAWFAKQTPKWCKFDIHLSALTYFFLSSSVKIKTQPLTLPVRAATSIVEFWGF